VRLQFENGCIYFKPRPMAIDVEFAEFIALLNRRGIGPDQRAPVVLDRGSYGYVGEVKHEEADCDETLRAYYRRFGGLIAIFHVLGTTDLQHENLIAAGSHPVVIDVETLFQPSYAGRNSEKKRRNALVDTVLHSGLLPHGDIAAESRHTSALFMPYESLYRRVPTGAGTDELRLHVRQVAMPFAGNMPRLSGKVAQPHCYVDEMLTGFDAAYRGMLSIKEELLSEQGPLIPFKSLAIRVVVRSTQVYWYLLTALSHPDYLASQSKRDELIGRIRPAKGGWEVYRRCWSSERAALLRGDVPYFISGVDSRNLHDERGNILSALYGSSGWKESRRRIRALSLHDLRRQRRLLQQAVICTKPNVPAELWSNRHPACLSPISQRVSFCTDEFVTEACHIGDRIVHAGFGDHDHIIQIQLEFRSQDVVRPYVLGPDLYDGLAGLAIFFGELSLRTGATRFRHAAEVALASARRECTQFETLPESIGAYCGATGWIYTLALLGSRLQRTDWIDEAFDWLPWIAERVKQDRNLDVIAGTAGALLVLTELERIAPGRGAITVARICAEHLAATVVQDEIGARWICETHPSHALTGFSHGVAGIAAALARFSAYAGDSQYLTLAQEALRFERSSYDGGGWPDLRKVRCDEHGGAAHSYTWCHGAPGIGFGRLLLPDTMRDASWRIDIDTCVALTTQHGFGGSHCLCHGQLGNLELLMKYDAQFPDVAADHWQHAATRLLNEGKREWRTGSVVGHDLLGFMTGLAGIGYGLLRIADPHNVPSVLMLELP
jgi:type 2 lantibiotic biosynthesis protein LanM